MTWRSAVAAVCAVLLVGAVSWAAVCPLCLQQIPDGEKYCSRHKAEMLVKTMSSGEEARLVAELDRARADYENRLDALDKFYESRGNAARLSQVRKEVKDHAGVRHFEYVFWEDRLPDLSATAEIPEAAQLLQDADALRTASFKPFNIGDRYTQAAAKYRTILQKYPTSAAVDSAAFGLGEIYSSGRVAEYPRAVKFYKLAYVANPATRHDACYRAAEIYDGELSEYEHAAEWYWLAAKKGKSLLTRKQSALRLGQLQKTGFGTGYSLEEKPVEPPEASASAPAQQ